MAFLENNLKLLQQFDKKLYTDVRNWLNESNDNFIIIEGKKGYPALKYVDNAGEKMVTSLYNPIREAELWARKVPDKKAYIVFGFGLGYHLIELAKKEDVKLILVVEPNQEVFCQALKHMDLSWLFESKIIKLSIAEDKRLQKSKLISIFSLVYNDFEYISLANYDTIFMENYLEITRTVNDSLGKYILEINTLAYFGKQWTENFFENLYPTLINRGVEGLFGKFKNVPAVIISAGPSLNKNIHLLKELKGKALLLSVGTSFKALKKHDIEPDLIVSIDGSYKNYKIFEGIGKTDIPLVYDPTIHHQIIREYPGSLIPADISAFFLNWFAEKLDISYGKLLLGPSVANVTFDLARKLEANPIIFVGQDLAYTDNQVYAEGTIYENKRIEEMGSKGQIYLEDVYGNQVLSSRSFKAFLDWFENVIEKTKDRIIIDATEGGAKIRGTEIMPLRQVIDQYCQKEYPIKEIINEFLRGNKPSEEWIVNEGLRLLKILKEEVKEFNKKAKKGLTQIEELEVLFKRPEANKRKINKILCSLDKIDEKLKSKEEGKTYLQTIFQPLVIPLLQGPDAKPKKDETQKEATERIIRFNRNLYDAFAEISHRVIEMIEKTEKFFTDKLNRLKEV